MGAQDARIFTVGRPGRIDPPRPPRETRWWMRSARTWTGCPWRPRDP